MLGTVINTLSIVFMGLFGYFAGRKLNEDLREYLMRVMGIVVFVVGLRMAFETSNFALMTLSIISGSFSGHVLGIENRLEGFGKKIERRFEGSKFAEGFISGTLLFCVGSMAIIGPIQEALTGDMTVLLTKSVLDGIASVVLSSTLGIGVLFSAIPVLVYQSFFYFGATAVKGYATAGMISEITAIGGVLIVAIGLDLMEVADLKPGNMLPSFVFIPVYMKLLSLGFLIV